MNITAIALQSGSSGNCIYVEACGVRLLFDAGINGRQAEARLAAHGRDIRGVDALIISHDHGDHIRYAGVYQRKYGLPLYVTEKTYDTAVKRHQLGKLKDVRFFRSDGVIRFNGVSVEAISTPHDASDGAAFVVSSESKRLGIMTDLGHIFEGLTEVVGSLDAVFLESNYDPLASGRPVYLIKPMPGLEIKADLSPAGSLFRATPYGPAPAHLLNRALPEITLSTSPVLTETISLTGYGLTPAQIRPSAPFTVTLHWQAVRPLSLDYSSYVHLVGSDGQGVTQSDHRPGGNFYPSHYWQPGETLRDQHLLTIPPTLPPGEYRLQTGMYYQPEPGVIKSMGAGVEMGTIRIE